MPEYQPGVCNIGKNETRKRYTLAIAAFVVSALVICIILLLHWPRIALLISFIPLFVAFEGFYQGYFKFCAGFAAAGIYDFTGSADALGVKGIVRNERDGSVLIIAESDPDTLEKFEADVNVSTEHGIQIMKIEKVVEDDAKFPKLEYDSAKFVIKK